jgi:TRAP-type C4-dicarboxylate transport system permease small subunit
MTNALQAFDRGIRKLLTWFCALQLLLMVLFTIYTVFMRYVFEDPPPWGDQMAVFSCIWLVFISLALTTREKEHIALDMLYTYLPSKWAFIIQETWNIVILLLGVVLLVWGWEVASTNPGKYWELGYMPKSYPMMILPITGLLIILGAAAATIEDTIAFRKGEFKVAKGAGGG